MSGIVKGVVYTVLGLVVLLVLAVVVLVTVVNPNDYREDISRLALDSAGVELKLGGELSWRFYPVLGFGAADVGLALQAGQTELVRIGEMTVGVRILPLLSGKVEVDALEISGLKANLMVDKKGKANWEMATVPAADAKGDSAAAKSQPATTPDAAKSAGSDGLLAEISIPLIRIRASSIQYEDQKAGAAYSVDLPLLELRDVNLTQPFPLLLEANVRDNANLKVKTRLEGKVSALLAQQQFGIADLKLAAEATGILDKPLALNLQGDVRFDQGTDKADISIKRLQLANLVAKLQLAATAVTTAPAFNGHLESDVFNARELMLALGLDAPDTQDADALTRVQLLADLAGTSEKVTVKPLTVKLDSSTLSGHVLVDDLSKQAIRFALELDKLNADRYLPPEAENSAVAPVAATSSPAAAQVAGELIPVETLRGLNLQGTFKAGEVIVKQIPLRDIALSISAKNGNVQITDLGAKLLQGTLAGSLQVDARQAQPKIVTRLDLNQIEVSDLIKPFVSAQLISGRTSLKVDTTTQGNDMDTLLQQALGQINVSMADTLVHGVNLNQVVTDAVKSKLGSFAALMPDYQEKLPKSLKGDTQIHNLLANMTVKNGHLLMPDFNADTGEGKFSANGDIDLLNKGFDYHFGVVLSALDGNKYLKGTQWPVRCKGNFETSAADWCRPDSAAIGQVLEKAAAVALRDKGAEKLGEKLGIQNADEGAVKEEIRQRAKAEEDKAKKKVSDSLKKLLEKR